MQDNGIFGFKLNFFARFGSCCTIFLRTACGIVTPFAFNCSHRSKYDCTPLGERLFRPLLAAISEI